ncbi:MULTISPECIES: hypothetical protein [unclassified Leifsonia]|uniref:hypothetical protein n=1 Tax=unclassified Leifsonia TaxID=2663824 RepID=UPI0006F40F7B|nr:MULTISPECIES: hypothetical protein [unclassified Leifsonia]KQX05642.1 hypothetical protein ASC59_16325 [Leifsonia sp. Root1293]KRA09277.1 hypothetical protein ASD61_16320 [Leifsonia sp. Root60]
MDTMLEGWTEFNLAIAGAGAALAGLIIVAMSVNIREILQTATIPARAAAFIGALLLGVTASCLALIPRQPLWALGVEILVGTVVAAWLEFAAARTIVREDRANGSPLLKNAAGIAPLVAFAAGSVLLIIGEADGYYGVAIGSILAILSAVLLSWIALVEILR